MSTVSPNKLNQLLQSHPRGIVLLSSYLTANGYSLDIIKRYKKSGWLESIGFGATIRSGDTVDYFGALHTLQTQLESSIHIGARSALAILGSTHYLELNTQRVILFKSDANEHLPKWFNHHDWAVELKTYSSSFLPPDLGLTVLPIKEFNVKISNEIRALLECLYLVPNEQEITECYEWMESMNNIHPQHAQALLEQCNSIKVKRLFLYLAEKANHAWFKHLNISNIKLGEGKRQIIKDGHLDEKYKITVPKRWKKHD